MKINSKTTATAFVSLFANEEKEQAMREKFPPEQDEEIILDHLRFAEKIFPKKGLGLCPRSHAKSQYYSLNCERILGWPYSQLIKMSLSNVFELVHPDDLPALKQCFQYIKNLMPFDPEEHRFIIHYRFRNKNNEYIHISSEQVAIKMQTHSYLYLMLYSNETHKEKFFHVRLDIFTRIKDHFRKTDSYNPQQKETEITPRQSDIAKLIVKGFTNQEIADRLGVSIYTVKNHKKTLFKKINVKSSLEFVNYVMEASV